MTIDLTKFSNLHKTSSASYHQQKALIKKVLAGKQINCEQCGKPLTIVPTKTAFSGIACAKGCTDILLDVE